MTWSQLTFENITSDQKEILIARLADIGFNGFEETGNDLQAFIEKRKFDPAGLNSMLGDQLLPTIREVEETNWNATWESSFQPVKIFTETGEPAIYLRASFHDPAVNYPFDIEVTPKMSFGTGHHATTQLMLEAMLKEDFREKAVIDYGTGTGVLAIFSSKKGARSVLAIDCDDWSIENAKENFKRNGCFHIDLLKAEIIPGNKKVDIILANINLNILLRSLSSLRDNLLPGGIIYFSGLLVSDQDIFCAALFSAAFLIVEISHKENWLAVKASYGSRAVI